MNYKCTFCFITEWGLFDDIYHVFIDHYPSFVIF